MYSTDKSNFLVHFIYLSESNTYILKFLLGRNNHQLFFDIKNHDKIKVVHFKPSLFLTTYRKRQVQNLKIITFKYNF